MKKNVVGLIVEYNPFHNGHLYHIKKVDELFSDNIKVGVMSGDFVQRGEPSILNKVEKTKIALSQGLDIVIELPAFYSTQSAEIFARGTILSLEKLSCTDLVFGSETNNLESLKKIKDLTNLEEFNLAIKKYLKEGISYPNAFQKAFENTSAYEFRESLDSSEKNFLTNKLKSNDILGLEYLKSLDFFNSQIKPHCIERKNVGYYEEKKENFASATYIRKILVSLKDLNLEEKQKKLEEIINLVPEYSYVVIKENLNNLVELKDFYDLLSYEILKNFEKLKNIQDIEVGLENRILEILLKNKKFESFFEEVISKRLTVSRLQRILLHIILGITKELTEQLKTEIPYVKILGFSDKGREYLNFLKKTENYEERKILTSSRNLKKYLTEEEIEIYKLNELYSNIYRLKNSYENINYPIIFKQNLRGKL